MLATALREVTETDAGRPHMLSCEETRQILWPLERPREFVPGEEDARAHLGECAHCRAFFAMGTRLTGVLARYGAAVKAPPELRARVMDAIAGEQRRAEARRRWRTRR